MLRHLTPQRQQPHQELLGGRPAIGHLHRCGEGLLRECVRCLFVRSDRVHVAHRHPRLGVVLRVAQQRLHLVLPVGEDHVPLVVQFEDQAVLPLTGAAGEDDDAIGAELLDLLNLRRQTRGRANGSYLAGRQTSATRVEWDRRPDHACTRR